LDAPSAYYALRPELLAAGPAYKHTLLRSACRRAGGSPIEVAPGVDLRKLSDGELEQLEELLTRASPEP
jgi:hypothetical protein